MVSAEGCPLCGDDIVSDATAAEYCALCGMVIKDVPAAAIKSGQGNKYFCSLHCYKNYKKFHREAG